MARSFDRGRFWEDKILTWEEGRYAPERSSGGLLEWFADRASASLRFRLASAGELLAPHVAGRHVVDVGSGSGRLAEAIVAAGAASYHGLDIAAAAVEAGRRLAASHGWDHVHFTQGGLPDLPDIPRDLVVSLGLTDWLPDAELDALFAWSGDAHYLHAVPERLARPDQWVHRAYVWVAYGHRTGGYVPRYFDLRAFAQRIQAHHPAPVRVWRDPRLSFGTYLTDLPIGEALA